MNDIELHMQKRTQLHNPAESYISVIMANVYIYSRASKIISDSINWIES